MVGGVSTHPFICWLISCSKVGGEVLGVSSWGKRRKGKNNAHQTFQLFLFLILFSLSYGLDMIKEKRKKERRHGRKEKRKREKKKRGKKGGPLYSEKQDLFSPFPSLLQEEEGEGKKREEREEGERKGHSPHSHSWLCD